MSMLIALEGWRLLCQPALPQMVALAVQESMFVSLSPVFTAILPCKTEVAIRTSEVLVSQC